MTRNEIKTYKENIEKFKAALKSVYADSSVSGTERQKLLSLAKELGLSKIECENYEAPFAACADIENKKEKREKIFDRLCLLHYCNCFDSNDELNFGTINFSPIEFIELGDTYVEFTSASYSGLSEPFALSIGQSFSDLLDEYGEMHIYDAVKDGKLQVFDDTCSYSDVLEYLMYKFNMLDMKGMQAEYLVPLNENNIIEYARAMEEDGYNLNHYGTSEKLSEECYSYLESFINEDDDYEVYILKSPVNTKDNLSVVALDVSSHRDSNDFYTVTPDMIHDYFVRALSEKNMDIMLQKSMLPELIKSLEEGPAINPEISSKYNSLTAEKLIEFINDDAFTKELAEVTIADFTGQNEFIVSDESGNIYIDNHWEKEDSPYAYTKVTPSEIIEREIGYIDSYLEEHKNDAEDPLLNVSTQKASEEIKILDSLYNRLCIREKQGPETELKSTWENIYNNISLKYPLHGNENFSLKSTLEDICEDIEEGSSISVMGSLYNFKDDAGYVRDFLVENLFNRGTETYPILESQKNNAQELVNDICDVLENTYNLNILNSLDHFYIAPETDRTCTLTNIPKWAIDTLNFGNESGIELTDDEKKMFTAWIERENIREVTGFSQPYFSSHPEFGLAGDCVDATFILNEPEKKITIEEFLNKDNSSSSAKKNAKTPEEAKDILLSLTKEVLSLQPSKDFKKATNLVMASLSKESKELLNRYFSDNNIKSKEAFDSFFETAFDFSHKEDSMSKEKPQQKIDRSRSSDDYFGR